MRPTPSPTGSGSGSRSMSPAVGQQSVSMPPRPSSSHSQTPNQQQQGPNHQHGNSNSNLVHGNQTQGPPDHHARVASPNRPPSASAQQQLPPVSTAQSGSASLPPSSQAGGGGSAGAAAGMAAQGYQAQAPHPPHMHGPYKMGPGGPGGMPPGGPGQQMSPYPPPPPHQQPPPQSQQYSPHSPASYSPRPQYPGAYGPSPPVPGPPPPGTQSPQQGPPGSGGPPPPHPPPGGYPGQHRMPNHVGAGGPPPPHSQYPPHQYPHQPPSPWGPPHTQAGPGGAGAGHVNNHVQQSQQGQSGPPTPGGPGGPRQGKGMPPGPPGAGGVHPQSPQQQQHSQHHQPPPHHQPHHQAHHQPPHHPGQAQSQQPPPQSGSPQPLNYLKQHLQHKGAYSGAPSPTPPPGQGYGNGPGMHPPMGPPHHMGPPMGLPPPPNASSMGPPPPAGTPPSQSPSGAGSSAVGHQHPSQQDSGHPPSPHQQQPPTQPQHPGQQSQQPQQQPPHSPHHHPHGPPPHAQHQPGHHPGADVPPQPHHGLLAGAGQDNGIVNATGGPGGGAVGGPHHHHHPHHHHPVTSLVTTGPDGAPLDEASQQSTLSNTSVASGEDPTCSTPKSRKNDHYNQSHLTGTNTPSSSNASPGPHNAHEDFELNSSPTSWPRTPASPVFNSHVPPTPETPFRSTKKSDSLNKLYEMDDKPERRVFLDKLLAYMDERRSPITACPTISKTPLDLYKLYVYVQERGGFVEVCKVTKSKTWKDIAGMLGIGASSSAAYTLRKHYTKNLLPFECKFDRGGIDPGPIIAQVEAGSKKKSAKTTSVPSPGSSNSQDSFPAPGSSSASMDGYGPYPGSGYPPGSTPDYVQQQQQQGSAGGPPGVATPGAQPGPGQQQTPQPQQRPPSQQSGTQSPHPGSAPPTSGDNISVSNPFDDPVGPQRPPYQQGAPYPPVSRPQGAPYQGQPGGYGQYGAPEQYGPSAGTPPGQYPPPPGQQGQYPPTNRPLYPPYAPPESGEGGTPPSSAAGVPGPPSGADPYRGYGSSPYPPPPQQRPYPPQQQPVVSAAPGVPPAGTPPIPGQAGGASQGQVPPGGPPTQQQQQPQQTPPPQQQPGAQGQPGAPGGYPAPVGQPGVPQSAADYYRQQQEQPNQPRRHPDFEKSQQPYPPYQQRPQMYPGGWQAGPGGQYRGQYPPQSPQQQWAHNGPRPSGPPGPPGAGGPPGGPPGAPGQWGAAADVNRYPPNQQQPPYPTHQQGQQQPWNQMPPTSQNSPLRPPLRSGKPYPPMAGAGPGVPTPPGSMPGMPPSSINTPPQPPGVVGGPPGATTSSGPVVPVTGGVPPVVPSAGGVVPGSGVPSVAGNATGVVPGVAPVPNASPAVKAQPSVQSGGQVQPAGPNFQPPGTGGVQQKRDIVFPTDSVEATTPVLYRRKRITKLDIGQTDAWRIFMALRSGLLVESTWALDVLNILLFDDSSVAYFGLAHMPGLLNLLLDHFQKSLCDMFESGKREGTTNRFSVEATNRAALLDKMLDVADDDEPEKEEQGHTMHSQSSIVNASSIAVTTTTTETTIKLEPASPMMMATTTMTTTTTTTTMIKQEKLENGLPDAAPLHHNGTQENGGRAATKCTGSAIDRRRTAQCYARRSTKPCDSNEELDLGSVKNPPNPDERTLILTSTTNYTMTSRKGRPVKIHPAEDDVFVLDHRRDWDRASDYQYQRDTEVGGDPWTAGHTDPDPHDYIMDTFRAEFVNIPFAKYIKTSAKYAEAAKAASGTRNGKRIAATINNNNCYISGISNNNNSAKCTSKNEREQQQEQTVHEAPAPAEKNTTTALKNTSEEVTEMDVEEDGEELLSPPKRRKEESSVTVTAPTLRTRKDHHIARLMNGESGEDEEAKEKAGDGGVEKVVKNCIVKKEKATVDDKEAAAPETVDSKAAAKGTTPTPMDADCREIDMELEKTSSLSNGPQEPAHTADTERENSNETSVTADREQHHQQNSVKSEDCQKSPAVVKPADEKMDIDESEENAALSAAVTVPAVRKTIAFDIAETVRDPARVLKRRRMSDYEDECYTRDEASLYLVTEGQDALARRCVAISNILRNLTFLPNNETEFSKSSRFLAILGKLLLLNHEHPLRTKKTRNYDREEDADFSDSCSSLQGEHEWWWDFLVQIRENMLVATANISGQLDLSRFDEPISRPILDGLLHWAVCPSAHGQDPFPTLGPNAALSPQRLALEALCKLCVTDANVDLVIATPPFSRLEKLCSVLTRHLCKNEDQVLREFSVNLLHYLAAADSSMARTVALQSPCVSYLVAFIEQAEQSALGVANQHGINFLRDNPDSMGTSLDMLRRAAGTLLHLAKHPDNRPLFMQQEQRLLGLVMSHILDQQVALIISRVLYQCSRGTGPLTTMEIESGGKPNSNASSSVTTASNTSSSAMEAKAGADSKTAMSANGSSSSLAAATPADGSSPSSATNGSGATTVTNSGTVSQQATANGQLAAEEFVTPSTPSTAANVSEGAESNRSGNVETSSIAGSTAVVAAYDESSSSSSSNATADHHGASVTNTPASPATATSVVPPVNPHDASDVGAQPNSSSSNCNSSNNSSSNNNNSSSSGSSNSSNSSSSSNTVPTSPGSAVTATNPSSPAANVATAPPQPSSQHPITASS